MPTTSEYLTDLVNQKNLLAENLNQMGVTASETEKLNTLVPKILTIAQNKSIATGTVTFTSQTVIFSVSGLNFRPSKFIITSNVVARTPQTSGTDTIVQFSFDSSIYNPEIVYMMRSTSSYNYGALSQKYVLQYGTVEVGNNGIVIDFTGCNNFLSTIQSNPVNFLSGVPYTWIALA